VAATVNSVELDRSPEAAFAYITDPATFTEWQDAVVSASLEGGGAPRQGAKVRLRRRVGRREQDLTTEFTEFDPPRRYAFRGIDGPIRPIGRGTVEPVGDGNRSRFTFELDFEGHGFGKLLLPLVRRQAQKELQETHRNLQQRLASGGA
jgi:hypothetical protein